MLNYTKLSCLIHLHIMLRPMGMNMSVEEFMEIDGVGDKGAKAVYDFFRDSENLQLIEVLRLSLIHISIGQRRGLGLKLSHYSLFLSLK